MDLFDDLPEPVNNQERIQDVHEVTEAACLDDVSGDNRDLSTNTTISSNRGAKRLSTDSLDGCDDDDSVDMKRRCNSSAKFVASLKGYVAERKGEREDMQDAHIILDQFNRGGDVSTIGQDSPRVSFYGVFDGHGGSRASTFSAKCLATNLRSRFPKGNLAQIEKDIRKSVIAAFKKTDEDFLKEATKQKPSWKDGTTALAILALQNTLYIANLGDSKAVLYRDSAKAAGGRGSVVSLSRDHNPTSYDERMRIQKMGGFVRDGRVMGVLEVSRSIGDGQYKTLGVTCLPDIKRCVLTEDDRFIIMACDGLWKVFSSEEAVDLVTTILKSRSDTSSGSHGLNCSESNVYEVACVRLAHEAIIRGSGDNVTVLIVAINRESDS